ncbi:26275_t:CDS:2, partial [Gigaspora rosea]
DFNAVIDPELDKLNGEKQNVHTLSKIHKWCINQGLEAAKIIEIDTYTETTELNWNNYRNDLDKMLSSNPTIKKVLIDYDMMVTYSVSDLDLIWKIIENKILEAARKNIPKKKILNKMQNKKHKQARTLTHKAVVALGKVIRQTKGHNFTSLDDDLVQEINIELKRINKEYKVKIPELARDMLEEWCSDIKG